MLFSKLRWMLLPCVPVLVTLILSEAGVAQLKLYDDFNSKQIDPSKWVGEPPSIPGASNKDRREVTVELADRKGDRRLHISERAYSATSDNNGAGGSGFGLGFAKPDRVKAMSFTLAVSKEQSVGCSNNPAFSVAGFFGDYFNPTGPQKGATGDITAGIGASRLSTDTGTTVDVSASISQCEDPKCNNQTTLSFQDLGPVPLGSTNTLSAAWDQPNHQFIFRLNHKDPVALTYTVPDTFPPGLADRSFYVFGSVPHCTTAPRPFVSIEAFFDNVYVNP
jgi:hypothetical protein